MVINLAKKKSGGVVYAVSEASVQKARNRHSSQLIKATSCVDSSMAMIQAKEPSYLSSYQMLTMDKIC